VRTTPTMLLLALSTTACYQYFPVYDTEPLPEAGAEVRIRLDEPQTLDLGTMTINEVSTVEGHVRQSESDNLSVFSNELRTFYGFRHRTNGAVFDFDRTEFSMLEQRKMVPWKTGAAIGITTVGLIATMHYVIDLGGGSNNGRAPYEPSLGRTVDIPLNVLIPLLMP